MYKHMEFTDAETRWALHLRALEWANWPAFLSALVVPLALVFFPVVIVLAYLLILSLGWTQLRYAFHSYKWASYAALAVRILAWPIAVTGFIWLLLRGRFFIAIVALLWPLLHGFIGFRGRVGQIELNFAREIGFVDSDDL